MISVLFEAALILAFALCCTPAVAQQQGDSNDSQRWGNRGIAMQMTAEGASLELDCAHGSILSPIQPGANGEFTVAGTYTPERGGPVQKNDVSNKLSATYKGTIKGDTMQLQIILSDRNQQLPPFILKRGTAGRLVKCR